MIILLTGPETYRSAQRLHQLRQAFQQKFDPSGFNTVTVDGSTATPEELRTAIQTTGFFSRQRFVAIDRYLPNSAACDPTTLSAIVQDIAKEKEVIVVIRQMEEEKKKKTFHRKSKKTAVTNKALNVVDAKVEEFPALTPAQTITWLLAEAKVRGGAIDQSAAEKLVMFTSNDLWRISSELDKLLAYADPAKISQADVEQQVASPFASDIFGLTDAIGQRRTSAALRLLHDELAAGTHPLALIATLANHVRNLLAVGQATGSPATLATELGLHPFVIKKALAQTKLFAPETLRNWHHQLVIIDFQLKTTRLDAETLLDVLLIKG